jgi:hypothetical protein
MLSYAAGQIGGRRSPSVPRQALLAELALLGNTARPRCRSCHVAEVNGARLPSKQKLQDHDLVGSELQGSPLRGFRRWFSTKITGG